MKLETSIGWIEASALAVEKERSETPAGTLVTTKFYFGDRPDPVKIDQHLEVSEAALEAAGITQL